MIVFGKVPTYYNEDIAKEVDEKGFTVYSYISLTELLLTGRKDYLDILSAINLPFGIISIILGVISYINGTYWLFFLFLGFSYTIIFCILFFKLLQRTYHFLLISDVVFTKKGIIFGDFLYKFGNTQNLHKKLNYYDTVFLEYLGGKSRLKEYIHNKKKNLIPLKRKSKLTHNFSNVFKKVGKNSGSSEGMEKIILIAILSFIIYVIFMYISYYIGYFLGIIFVKIYSFFIRGMLFFRDSLELQIKKGVTDIDQNILKMNRIYALLDSKYVDFRNGNITDISKFTQNNFDDFYSRIFGVYEEKKKLEKLIHGGKYKKFIDFGIFEKYLKKTFNKPIHSMLSLLKQSAGSIRKQLTDLEKTVIKADGLGGHIQTKKIILENNLEILLANISKLEQSLI